MSRVLLKWRWYRVSGCNCGRHFVALGSTKSIIENVYRILPKSTKSNPLENQTTFWAGRSSMKEMVLLISGSRVCYWTGFPTPDVRDSTSFIHLMTIISISAHSSVRMFTCAISSPSFGSLLVICVTSLTSHGQICDI